MHVSRRICVCGIERERKRGISVGPRGGMEKGNDAERRKVKMRAIERDREKGTEGAKNCAREWSSRGFGRNIINIFCFCEEVEYYFFENITIFVRRVIFHCKS